MIVNNNNNYYFIITLNNVIVRQLKPEFQNFYNYNFVSISGEI